MNQTIAIITNNLNIKIHNCLTYDDLVLLNGCNMAVEYGGFLAKHHSMAMTWWLSHDGCYFLCKCCKYINSLFHNRVFHSFLTIEYFILSTFSSLYIFQWYLQLLGDFVSIFPDYH